MINVSIAVGTSIRRSINTYMYTYIDIRLNMGMSIDRPCL